MLQYSEYSYAINGAAFHVYNKLGFGFLESVYQEALEVEFRRRNIPYEREKILKITYDGIELKTDIQSRLCLLWENNSGAKGCKHIG